MEIHIGDRIADITLVGKEGNKVQLTIECPSWVELRQCTSFL